MLLERKKSDQGGHVQKAGVRALGLAALALAAFDSAASAQDTVRVRGTIDRVDGPIYVVKARDGAELKISLAENGVVVAIVKASLADIKPGLFVGSTGMPQPDGSQKAVEVHIFPEAMRGIGEGHYAWDLKPDSTMTNANVEETVAGVEGQVLTLKYKTGEKKIVVTPQTAIVTYNLGDNKDLKPGTKIFIAAAKKQAVYLAGRAHQLRKRRPHAADVSATGKVPMCSIVEKTLRVRSDLTLRR